MRLLTGSNRLKLFSEISSELDEKLVRAKVNKFLNGEIKVEIDGSFKDERVYILLSTVQNPNDSYMELFFLIDAVKKATPKSITVILPYLAYSRQDRKTKDNDYAAIEGIANILSSLGISKVITVDLHSEKIKNLFKMPLINIEITDLLTAHLKKYNKKNTILVSPDAGGRPRVEKLSKNLETPYAVITKKRNKANLARAVCISKNVRDKVCYLVDDIIDTGGTMLEAINLLSQNMAKEVHIFATHGLFSKDPSICNKNPIVKSLTITNTINLPLELKIKNIRMMSVSKLIAANITK